MKEQNSFLIIISQRIIIVVFMLLNKTLAPNVPFLPALILGLHQDIIVMTVIPIIAAAIKGFTPSIATIIATLETVLLLQQ